MDTIVLTDAPMDAEVDIRALEMLPAEEPEGLYFCTFTCEVTCLVTYRI